MLNRGKLLGGTLHTVEYAQKYARPCLVVRLDAECDFATVTRWIADEKIRSSTSLDRGNLNFPVFKRKHWRFSAKSSQKVNHHVRPIHPHAPA
ncbi:putative molybdenum carrier protein [Geobacter sulfurreducens]|uniref:putative molybdenum carrier protein n=1 Tax=Geobacter sulfurreducens TaxID=35554 RepID=UPI001F25A601